MKLNTIPEDQFGENQEAVREDSEVKTTQVKVVYEIKIVCLTELDLPDGSAVQITWHRGNQTLDTSVKILQGKKAYFL